MPEIKKLCNFGGCGSGEGGREGRKGAQPRGGRVLILLTGDVALPRNSKVHGEGRKQED